MADQINPTHYENMIAALTKFVADTSATCENLGAASRACTQILGDTDDATDKILSNVSSIRVAYGELMMEADRISKLMQQELETYSTGEKKAWEDESEDSID